MNARQQNNGIIRKYIRDIGFFAEHVNETIDCMAFFADEHDWDIHMSEEICADLSGIIAKLDEARATLIEQGRNMATGIGAEFPYTAPATDK